MTIAQAFNEIAVAQGGTPNNGGTIAGAIDALNDALAGSDQESAQTIEDAVRLLGAHIGGGSSVTVESLTATENKTYTAPEGKAYSPVNVNVSGGLPTANVTVINSDDTYAYTIFLPFEWEYEEDGETQSGVSVTSDLEPGETIILKVPLYGNMTDGFIEYIDGFTTTYKYATISVSGNITNDDHTFVVTGDGTITITGMLS